MALRIWAVNIASYIYKILGVTFDYSMNMKKAIANTCRSAHYAHSKNK